MDIEKNIKIITSMFAVGYSTPTECEAAWREIQSFLRDFIADNNKVKEIEEIVIAKIRQRRKDGRVKYNTTMERTDLSLLEWAEHTQGELTDAAIYLEKFKQMIMEGKENGQKYMENLLT